MCLAALADAFIGELQNSRTADIGVSRRCGTCSDAGRVTPASDDAGRGSDDVDNAEERSARAESDLRRTGGEGRRTMADAVACLP